MFSYLEAEKRIIRNIVLLVAIFSIGVASVMGIIYSRSTDIVPDDGRDAEILLPTYRPMVAPTTQNATEESQAIQDNPVLREEESIPRPNVRAALPPAIASPLEILGSPYVGFGAPNVAVIEAGVVDDGTVYYVDCTHGDDANNGLSIATPWESMEKANAAPLSPGDKLLFKRGCGWIGPLNAVWHGKAGKPILIGAYGEGELPTIHDSQMTNVRILGSYLIFENLHATTVVPPNPDPNCNNQPVGYKIGFGFGDGAAYNTVVNSMATRLAIGISFDYDSHDNRAIYNAVTDNNMLWELTESTAGGATGILLHGDRQEIARNFFARNRPICNYTTQLGGISIELYGATNADIHHNIVDGDRIFTEMGSSPTRIASSNTFAYNLHTNDYSGNPYGARFVVTRGYDHPFGPVLNTIIYNNMVYFTGAGSKAVTCERCGEDILTLKNNILWADQPFWSDATFIEANNIFWSSSGAPRLTWHDGFMNANSLIADPQFFDAENGDFHLRESSPAINRATSDVLTGRNPRDLDKKPVALDGALDVGPYEYNDSLNGD